MPVEFTGVDWVNEERKAQDGARRREVAKRRRKARRNWRWMSEQKQQIQRFLLWICANSETSIADKLLKFDKCTEFIEAVDLFLPENATFLKDSGSTSATKIVYCLRNVKLWIDRDVTDGTMSPRDVCFKWIREGIADELLKIDKCTEFIEAVALFLPEYAIFLNDSENTTATKIAYCLRNVELWIDRNGTDGMMSPRDVCFEWRREGIANEFYKETEHNDAETTISAISPGISDRFSEVVSEIEDRIVRELDGLLRNSENETESPTGRFSFSL